ncbi:hypothetical protein EXIGLDRAFT_733257 [Exidia glandulosa HHB12029]|uniref:Uncharacterized protein n=1 Tax=Exidia glandulosa HHB12029 TaxID=1314781 RepID=A0A165BCK2_EXIGL|nr:hypothetical protein EXIGLDRAFT_733257 [Exidia glandulosa HHB12029]
MTLENRPATLSAPTSPSAQTVGHDLAPKGMRTASPMVPATLRSTSRSCVRTLSYSAFMSAVRNPGPIHACSLSTWWTLSDRQHPTNIQRPTLHVDGDDMLQEEDPRSPPLSWAPVSVACRPTDTSQREHPGCSTLNARVYNAFIVLDPPPHAG